jgi:hypothetical protein
MDEDVWALIFIAFPNVRDLLIMFPPSHGAPFFALAGGVHGTGTGLPLPFLRHLEGEGVSAEDIEVLQSTVRVRHAAGLPSFSAHVMTGDFFFSTYTKEEFDKLVDEINNGPGGYVVTWGTG